MRPVVLRGLISPRASTPLLLVGLALLVASSACSVREQIAYSPHELRAKVATDLPVRTAGALVVPYEVSPALVGRALRYTDGPATRHSKASLLTRAISNHQQFGLRWERVTTTVARDAVANGYGNCLSLTSVFVGLARGIGLEAYYVDASDRVNTLERENELLIRTGHIIATVKTERGWSMVDFTGEVANYRTFRVISDVEAVAHFYNNRGFELLITSQAKDDEIPWDEAIDDFKMATHVQPDFARAHNNLGVAFARTGDVEAARSEYLAAIQADSSFSEPRHNLGNLHLRTGDYVGAIRWYGVAIKLEAKNPYLHFHLGLAQYQSGDVEASIESFQRAIALKHDYIEPRNVLAQAYRQQGRHEEADAVQRAAQQQRREG